MFYNKTTENWGVKRESRDEIWRTAHVVKQHEDNEQVQKPLQTSWDSQPLHKSKQTFSLRLRSISHVQNVPKKPNTKTENERHTKWAHDSPVK